MAEEYALSPETLSRRLASLRRAGLIELQVKPRLGGGRLYRLTPAGTRELQAALPYWTRAQERLRATLGWEQWWPAISAVAQMAAAARKAESAKIVNTTPKTESVAAAR